MAAHVGHEHAALAPVGRAIVRELWYARDDIARDRDTSLGRVLPDAALVEIAKAAPQHRRPTSPAATGPSPATAASGSRPCAAPSSIPEDDLPPRTLPSDGPPPPRVWAEKNPLAADRLGATRAALTAFAVEHVIPVENVVLARPAAPGHLAAHRPTTTRRRSPGRCSTSGARQWQAEIVAPMLAAAFRRSPDA